VTGRFEAWLAGGKAAPASVKAAVEQREQVERDHRYPGQRYGLPPAGPGSVASLGRRLIGLVVDCVLAELVTSLFVHPGGTLAQHAQTLNYWSLLTWVLITVIGTAFFGVTPGMLLAGIRVMRVDGAALLLPVRAIVRAVLVALIIPGVVWDGDRRGLHDRAAGTIVLRSGRRTDQATS
jgi:uncharacterized RDD family membrane protein YckC